MEIERKKIKCVLLRETVAIYVVDKVRKNNSTYLVKEEEPTAA